MAKDYNISKTSGLCVSCQNELPVGEEFVNSSCLSCNSGLNNLCPFP